MLTGKVYLLLSWKGRRGWPWVDLACLSLRWHACSGWIRCVFVFLGLVWARSFVGLICQYLTWRNRLGLVFLFQGLTGCRYWVGLCLTLVWSGLKSRNIILTLFLTQLQHLDWRCLFDFNLVWMEGLGQLCLSGLDLERVQELGWLGFLLVGLQWLYLWKVTQYCDYHKSVFSRPC